jgi:6-pyruvoyltetrahydropterin/6-carboxytetrahydropterin synthase
MFSVTVEKEHSIFSAAHFITFAGANGEIICESLHGHNYRVAVRVEGVPDEHGLVIDFIWLRDRIHEITSRLDHHVLLPDRHAQIRVEAGDREVVARFGDRRWVFPREDVVLLPLGNTTAERLAEFIGGELLVQLRETLPSMAGSATLTVGVDENEGQWGHWRQNV